MITDKGFKRGFVSADVFNGLGYSWTEVGSISDYDLSKYPNDPVAAVLTLPLPDGTLVKASDSGAIYVITNGKKRWIASASVFTALGYDWNRIVTVSPNTLNSIGTISSPIDDNQLVQCRPY